MATIMIASAAAMAPPHGLGRSASLSVGRTSPRVGGWGSAAAAAPAPAKVSLSPEDSQSSTRPLPSLHALFQDAPKLLLSGAQSWRERIADTDLGKAVAPIAASAGFYWQASASALEDVVKVEHPPTDLTVIWVTSGIYAVLYLFVIPAVVYNYLRLRWYKRNAAETFFQFLLVFVFFPGMLLLAPFINFRRLPREGTKPP